MSFLFKKGFSSEILTTSIIVNYARVKFVAVVVVLIKFILATIVIFFLLYLSIII